MPTTFAEAMQLEEIGADRFAAEGFRYAWGVLFGGQTAAHALRAASATVSADRLVHSLHASYLEAGRDDLPVELTVRRLRDGRSFSVRAVEVTQDSKLLATVTAGFHVDEGSPDVSLHRPDAPFPQDLLAGGWSDHFDRRYVPLQGAEGRTLVWTRLADELGDDRVLQACALAYVADDIPDEAVIARLHPEAVGANDFASRDPSIGTQGLDYSLWLHRPIRRDGWILHDFRCSGISNACAGVLGEVFDAEGLHLATVGQHVLLRYRS